MFKSQLQEYAHKAGLSTPVYDATKTGPSHEPQFKASVTIHGKVYESPAFFGNLKQAEQAAAGVALAALGKPEVDLLQESGLCKTLLQEYAQKTKLPIPVYSFVRTGDSHSPTFSATVEIAGVHYSGGKYRTKKEAEIKAARTALIAICPDLVSFALDGTEDQTLVDDPASAAGEVTGQPGSGSKRKKFTDGSEERKQKPKVKLNESVEVGNNGTFIDDSKQANGSPSTGSYKESQIFKSQLQEYAQKFGLPTPVYDVTKKGPSHEPQFKASVTIYGKVYESPTFFGNLKKAEHAAAEVALAALGQSQISLLHESGLCKTLLQEYAQKTKLPLPVYSLETTGHSHQQTFSATVEIAGVHYNGGNCKTRKEAEIKAARTALSAIYADSCSVPLGPDLG